MDNEQLLQEISSRVAGGSLQRSEVMRRIGEETDSTKSKNLSLTKILYGLGIVVSLMGIIFLVAQLWDDMGSVGRILITLVLGFVFAGVGSFFMSTKQESHLGQVFHVIGGLLIPGGAMVTLSEVGVDFTTLWPVTITVGVIALFYLMLTLYHKNDVLTFFTVANGTAFIYLLTESIIDGPFYNHEDVYAYLTMVMGIVYLSLAQGFKDGWNRRLVGVLYFFGSLGFLWAAFTRVFDSGLWEFLFFVLAVGGVALSVYLKSKSILAVSTIFLIAHFVYITSEYFADSIGWPISLVILGFVFIGLGYTSISISKKYITSSDAK